MNVPRLGASGGRVVPLCVYGVTAAVCWLVPWRLEVDDLHFIINAVPTKALALATVSLAVVHWALALRGRTVAVVAACWAVATTSMVTTFAVSPVVSASTWTTIMHLQSAAIGVVVCALSVLGWQLIRRRLAAETHILVRGCVVLGVAMLAFNYAEHALRELNVLPEPVGLDELADFVAGFTVDLWISSGLLLLGAVVHIVISRVASRSRTA